MQSEKIAEGISGLIFLPVLSGFLKKGFSTAMVFVYL